MDANQAVLVAKMELTGTEKTYSGGEQTGEVLKLSAVYGDGEANKQWSKWTPSGSLTLHVTNPDALEKVGRGYYKVLLVPCGKED